MNEPTVPAIGSSLRRRVLRLLTEAVVVVGSILLAFALDAWWDRRELRQEIDQELASVRLECVENRQRVAEEMQRIRRVVAASEAILNALETESGVRNVAVQDTLAWIVTVWAPTLDASLGAVDALISSGRLAAIGNLPLRNALAGLRDRFSDAAEEEMVARQLLVTAYLPATSQHLDYGPLLRLDKEATSSWTPSERLPSFGQVMYPNTLELKNVIRARIVWYQTAEAEMTNLLRELDNVIALTSPDGTQGKQLELATGGRTFPFLSGTRIGWAACAAGRRGHAWQAEPEHII